jgi:HlyD family secretion protein
MKKKRAKLIVIVFTLVVVTAVLFNMSRSKTMKAGIDAVARNEVEYIVEKGNIEVAVTGSSGVTPTDKRTVKSEIDGSVDSIYVTEGDLVDKNQVLIALKSSSEGDNQLQIRDIDLNIQQAQNELNDLYDSKGDLTIYAESTGVISNISIEAGDEISSNYTIGTIKDTGNSYIEVYFLKNAYENISIGDSVNIFMPNYFVSETGLIEDKDSTPVQMGGGVSGYKVTVKMNNPGGYAAGDLAQISVTNSNGSYEGMSNGKIIETKAKNIISKVSGKVKSVNVENGKNISEGTLIAVIEATDMELKIAEKQNQVEKYKSQREDLLEGDTIYSPMKGTILQIDVSEEEVVDRTTTLMTVADLDKMKAVIAVDELDITKVKLGQLANITCDAFMGENFTGKVSKISLEGVNQNGVTTYDLTIEIDVRKQLMSGMNVDVEIIFESRENVLTVPIEALHKINGEYMVTTKDESGNKTDVKVELGLVTDDIVEISNGLKEGDTIVYNKIQAQNGNFGMMVGPAEGPGPGGGRVRVNNND